MLYLSYENETGRLHFSGGSGHRPWKVIDAAGFGLAEKSLNTAAYPSQVGQTTLSQNIGARTITVQCDVHSQNNSHYEISRALKILNQPGELILRNGYKTYKINARCIDATPGERHGGYRVFTMQFICDYPYFEDREDTETPIFKIEKLIGSGTRWYIKDNKLDKETIDSGMFKLPCMFGLLTTEANVINSGDVDTEPIVIITMLGDVKENKALTITNETTKQTLTLRFPVEVITKDKDGKEEKISYNPEKGDVIT